MIAGHKQIKSRIWQHQREWIFAPPRSPNTSHHPVVCEAVRGSWISIFHLRSVLYIQPRIPHGNGKHSYVTCRWNTLTNSKRGLSMSVRTVLNLGLNCDNSCTYQSNMICRGEREGRERKLGRKLRISQLHRLYHVKCDSQIRITFLLRTHSSV